jgi:Spy/CpxP family protein refolding chaperone
MTDTNTTPSTSPATKTTRARRWLLLALPAVLLGTAVGASAYAIGPDGGPSPEHMDRFFEHRLDRMLENVNATADQKTRIKAIVARVRPELKTLAEQKAKLHAAGKNALLADRIDANEVERVRRETMALADRGSSLMSRTLVEIGGVLTPQQRKELAEKIESRRHHWRH